MDESLAAFLATVLTVLATGCVPASRIHETRALGSVEAGCTVDREADRLVASDAELDRVAKRFTAVFEDHGFRKQSESDGYGIVPWTGHTKSLAFTFDANPDLHARIEMTKRRFTCKFEHVESEPRSSAYIASGDDIRAIDAMARRVRELAASVFAERAVRVTTVHRPHDAGTPLDR